MIAAFVERGWVAKKADYDTDKLRKCERYKEEGVQNPKILPKSYVNVKSLNRDKTLPYHLTPSLNNNPGPQKRS